MTTTPEPRVAMTHAVSTDGPSALRYAGHPMTAIDAAVTVRAARRNRHQMFDAVHVYATTDRTGAPLIVAYVHYRTGFWYANDYFDVYEIPTDALTDL
ncbi:hypothetical protein OG896_23920 [Streptomyces sp. NBC_00669]|uniref:hypothetical protein n=1 Tax=Streptomyces sp. NBC_00669 TaxID=2976011 RepID=UPI002E33FC17|nr:hypothetical protein [Streptomyces sp. NBC_00669]